LKRLRIPDPVLLLAFCGFFFLWRLAAFGLIGAGWLMWLLRL
jgi:hypothetical protein